VEDRPGCRMQVVSARGASPRLAALLRLVAFESPLRIALRAVRRLTIRRVTRAPQVDEAASSSGKSRMNSIREYDDSDEAARIGWRRSTGGTGLLLVGKSASAGATVGAFALSTRILWFGSDGASTEKG